MGNKLANGVYFFPLTPIETTGGQVKHAIKGLDEYLKTFGECYFSTVRIKEAKAWKKHTKMTCNLFVPKGAVKFVFYDDRQVGSKNQIITEFLLDDNLHYGRLIIKPGIWFGFAGAGDQDSIILNVSDLPHDPTEGLRLEPGSAEIPYKWQFDN